NRTSIVAALVLFVATSGFAQSKQYQRKKPAEAPAAAAPGAPATAPSKDGKAAPAAKATPEVPAQPTGDKLDISELEQKYWAPKDTDFSVVQNRTYTKAGKLAASFMYGPIVNDTFSSGMNAGLLLNYYKDERFGFQAHYISSDLSNSDATKKFFKLSGGATAPDFNRVKDYYGLGFNFVPFYAKMSVMGQKIIYFDMQITPTIGMTKYEQQQENGGGKSENSFSYGLDVTQYFFFSKSLAVRFDLQNRWYKQDVVAYKSPFAKVRSGETENTTMFLFGLTYFH
ncbi:MAG: outer membrane beta-barrel domain-containing protein, partial [Bdellovibrionota bacterium]